MSNKDNGGPAFPCEGGRRVARGSEIYKTLPSDGMTMRDYFAAKASDVDVDLIMDKHFIDYELTEFGIGMKRYSITRQQARYIHADAMLEARNQ